ncbi:hypothetical protein MIR68_005977 [Amoeboaphelidium protococcarum]|nr:hypothetical protein MIR68_005977 [Amoeboaphelidium protococcarum]
MRKDSDKRATKTRPHRNNQNDRRLQKPVAILQRGSTLDNANSSSSQSAEKKIQDEEYRKQEDQNSNRDILSKINSIKRSLFPDPSCDMLSVVGKDWNVNWNISKVGTLFNHRFGESMQYLPIAFIGSGASQFVSELYNVNLQQRQCTDLISMVTTSNRVIGLAHDTLLNTKHREYQRGDLHKDFETEIIVTDAINQKCHLTVVICKNAQELDQMLRLLSKLSNLRSQFDQGDVEVGSKLLLISQITPKRTIQLPQNLLQNLVSIKHPLLQKCVLENILVPPAQENSQRSKLDDSDFIFMASELDCEEFMKFLRIELESYFGQILQPQYPSEVVWFQNLIRQIDILKRSPAVKDVARSMYKND